MLRELERDESAPVRHHFARVALDVVADKNKSLALRHRVLKGLPLIVKQSCSGEVEREGHLLDAYRLQLRLQDVECVGEEKVPPLELLDRGGQLIKGCKRVDGLLGMVPSEALAPVPK